MDMDLPQENVISMDEAPEQINVVGNGLIEDADNDELADSLFNDADFQLPEQVEQADEQVQLPDQPVRTTSQHLFQLPEQAEQAQLPENIVQLRSSQKHNSQNISSINNMNPLPRMVDENPACPNGACNVNRQIAPQFNNNNNAPPLPGSDENRENPINLPAEPPLPQGSRQSEQLPQVNPRKSTAPPPLPTNGNNANNTTKIPPPPPLPATAQQPAQQQQSPAPKNKFPPLPTTAQQHHPASPTQFNQQKPAGNLFTRPVNQPAAQQQQQPAQQQAIGKAALPTFNNNNSNPGGLIRPPTRPSKTLIPSLFWDGQVPITNMRSLTEKNNKNILTHVEPIPYTLIEQVFPYINGINNRVLKRFVITDDIITLTYIIPDSKQGRTAWENQLKIDQSFKKFVDDYNQEIKQRLSEIYNIPLEQMNQIINDILTQYMNANTDRLSRSSCKSSTPSFSCYNGVCYVNKQQQQCNTCNNNNAQPQQQQQQQPCNTCNNNNNVPPLQQPCRYYRTRKECMDSAAAIPGYRRVMRSQNPCVVDYIEIKNKKDLQDSMIGFTCDNPIVTDADCAVKYNMIKTFLDESGYHLEKNSTRKSRKSRKN